MYSLRDDKCILHLAVLGQNSSVSNSVGIFLSLQVFLVFFFLRIFFCFFFLPICFKYPAKTASTSNFPHAGNFRMLKATLQQKFVVNFLHLLQRCQNKNKTLRQKYSIQDSQDMTVAIPNLPFMHFSAYNQIMTALPQRCSTTDIHILHA